MRLQSPRPFSSGATLTVHLDERYPATTVEVVRLAIAHVIAEKGGLYENPVGRHFLAGLLIMVALPVLAHHGNAAIDNSQQVTVTGTITDWVWANPHSRSASESERVS